MQNTASPTILKSPDIQQTASQISKNPQGWFKRNMLMAIVILVVLGVALFGAFSYFSPEGMRSIGVLQPSVNEMTSASLSLIPERSSYKRGETVVVDVKLFTGGQMTDSADLVVKFDPAYLEPQVEGFVSVGQVYSEYPPAQIDAKAGLIGLSGITIPNSQGFSGVGNFARLNFVALKEGKTQISIDHTEGSTADSNVVLTSSATDILGFADSTEIIISATDVAENKALPNSCGSFTQYCQDATGKVGTQVCNAGTISNGTCGYNYQITNSCEVCKI